MEAFQEKLNVNLFKWGVTPLLIFFIRFLYGIKVLRDTTITVIPKNLKKVMF